MKNKDKSGISLIVLVITIIVIIILAVAVILSISNNNPIENARKARFLNDLKTIQEEVALHIGKQYVEKNGNYDPSTDDKINDILNNYPEYKDKITIEEGKVTLDGSKISEEQSNWAKENGVTVKEPVEEVVEPVIPVGFKHIEGTIDTGYVIQNETDKNEFVWVPVEVPEGKTFEEVFVRESFKDTDLSTSFTEPLSYNGATADVSETTEYEAMFNSVKKYKGFYIARYEASNNGNGEAQSKKNQPSWERKWGISTTDLSGGAVESSRSVYPYNTSKTEGSAVSTLCYGVQWDATVRWLEKSYSGISKDSSDYGNYNFDINVSGYGSINTGSNPKYVTNNIYDMCGNKPEWTMEALTNSMRVYRGSNTSTSLSGSSDPISKRGASSVDQSVGFRIALYIK